MIRVALPLGIMVCAFSGGAQTVQKSAAVGDPLVSGFRSPPSAAKLRCYWWWLNGNVTRESIAHDLTEMKAKGYGGVLLIDANGADAVGNDPVPAGPTFGSPEWMGNYLFAVEMAHKLGLEIILTITSGWNLGAPFIQPKDAIKLLTWTRTAVDGGETALAAPKSKGGFYERIAVLAYPLHHGAKLAGKDGDLRAPRNDLAQKTSSVETGGSMPKSAYLLVDTGGEAGDEDAEVSEVVDVTEHVDSAGVLHWTAPAAGPWEVLNIGYTISGTRLSPGSGAWQGLSIDPLSPAALDVYWDTALRPLLDAAKPYLGNTIKYLATDSPELGGMNWTKEFREEFRRRRGYDPVRYLPTVVGRILSSRETSDRFLADFRRTIGDLYNTHYDHMAERAAKYGLSVECEPGGPHGEPIDGLETFRHMAVPQTEYWAMSKEHRVKDEDRYFVKEASSAAHIYGKPLVAAEGMTSMGNYLDWSTSIGMNMKPSFDMALTEGLNRLIWHQFTSSPKEMGLPGQQYFAGTYLNPNVTWWEEAGAFTAYLNRAQFLLQQGEPVADVLYYYGDQVPNFVRLKSDDPAGVLPGHDYDVTDTDALLHRIVADERGLRTPEGIRYRMLVLPASRIIPLEALELVGRFLHEGGVVAGLRPLRPQGIVPEEEDRKYQELAASLWSGCEAAGSGVAVGRGRLFCGGDGRDALRVLHVSPDVETTSDAIDFVHRRSAGAEIYFIRNSKPEAVTADVTFRVSGRQPEMFDAVTGDVSAAMLYDATSDGRTRMPFALAPYESRFVIFRHPAQERHLALLQRDGEMVRSSLETTVTQVGGAVVLRTTTPGSYVATFAGGVKSEVEIAPVSAPEVGEHWTLSFPAGWGAPARVELGGLRSWTEFEDVGIRYFSGTATYRSTIEVSADQLGGELLLDLGEVHEVARIRVNGVPLTPLWKQPFSARVDALLHAGENTIEVEVTNFWPNRLIGDAQPGVSHRYTWTNVKAFTASSPLSASGLLGPVKVVPVYVRRISSPGAKAR